MAKKGGGFRGYKPVMSTSAGAFARRGNPWVTKKEGERDYDRQIEVENPDMDADRQRHERMQAFSKEFRDRVRPDFDFKMTMREAIETEKSVRMDSYNADKAFRPSKPKFGQWPERGKDFQVDTVQRRCASIAHRLKRDLRAMESDKFVAIRSGKEVIGLSSRVSNESKIACPYECGYVTHDSRNISKHLRRHRNSCCTHPNSCQCDDCKYSRNEL